MVRDEQLATYPGGRTNASGFTLERISLYVHQDSVIIDAMQSFYKRSEGPRLECLAFPMMSEVCSTLLRYSATPFLWCSEALRRTHSAQSQQEANVGTTSKYCIRAMNCNFLLVCSPSSRRSAFGFRFPSHLCNCCDRNAITHIEQCGVPFPPAPISHLVHSNRQPPCAC
jgi:hypothetical protein